MGLGFFRGVKAFGALRGFGFIHGFRVFVRCFKSFAWFRGSVGV